MKTYRYKAINLSGEIIKGEYNTKDKKELIKSIRDKGYFLIECKLCKFNRLLNILYKRKYKDIAIFCRQFYEVIKCGIDLNKGLNIISRQNFNPSLNISINKAKNDIEKGKSISESFSNFPDVFPRFMVSMIKIGEQSGKMEKILLNLYKYYMNEHNIHSKIKSLLIYPTMVMLTTLTIGMFIIIKIFPMILENITNNNIPITSELQNLINVRNFLLSKWPIVIFSMIIIFGLLAKKKIHKSKSFIEIKFKLPIIKKFYKKLFEIRFIESLNMLISSGVPIINSLEIIEEDLEVEFHKSRINKLIIDIREGQDFSTSLEKTGLFSELFISMMKIGEETGSMESMLDNVAKIYKDNLKVIVDKFSRYIEPVTIIFLAAIITVVILKFVFPMLNIMDSIQIGV